MSSFDDAASTSSHFSPVVYDDYIDDITPPPSPPLSQAIYPRERLFEMAIEKSDIASSGLTLRAIVEDTLRTSVPLCHRHADDIHEWLRLVLRLASLSNFATAPDELREEIQAGTIFWMREFGMDGEKVAAILSFMGVTLKGRRKTTKNPLNDFFVSLTAALSKYYIKIQRRDGLNLPHDAELYICPSFLRLVMLQGANRFNENRGTTKHDVKIVESRNCRFCDFPVKQIRLRKRPVHQIAEEVAEGSESEKENVFSFDPTTSFYRKKTFCDEGCVFLYLWGSSDRSVRSGLQARDASVCSSCGVDSLRFLKDYRKAGADLTFEQREVALSKKATTTVPFDLTILEQSLIAALPSQWASIDRPRILACLMKRIEDRIRKSVRVEIFRARKNPKLGLREGDLWQGDHTVPVILNGGNAFTSMAFRTLCFVCHRNVTKRLIQSLRGENPAVKK